MSARNPSASFKIGAWLAEPATDRLTSQGQVLKLEPRSMAVLVYLAQQHGRVVSLRELDTQVWGEAVVAQSSMYQAINLLRRALGDTEKVRRYIETIPRKGYRLIAPIEWQVDECHPDDSMRPRSDQSVDTSLLPTLPSDLPEFLAPEDTAPGVRRRLRGKLPFAMLTVAVCVLGACAMAVRPLLRSTPPALVVLPFVDMTVAKSEQAFCDGLAEELSNRLAQIPKLRVVARTSALKFRNAEDVRSIGKELAATHVLEGSVRRGQGGIRITAQLVNTVTGYQDWSKTFDTTLTDILRIQDQVAREVAAVLQVSTSPAMAKRLRTQSINAQAFWAYLEGKAHFAKRTPQSYDLAIQRYRKTLELEPEFAEAYVGLVDVHLNRLRDRATTLEVATREIEPLLASALQLNDELPEAYLARGTLRNEQARFEDAERDLRHAIELNASMVNAHSRLGQILEQQGRPTEALQQFIEATELDPYDPYKHALQCLAQMSVGRFQRATLECERARELGPGTVWPLYASAIIEEERGRPDLALTWYRAMSVLQPEDVDGLLMQAKTYLDLQLHEPAKELYARALLRSRKVTHTRMSPAEVMLGTAELATLRDLANPRDLVLGSADTTPDNLLIAAFHCMVAGVTACAEDLVQEAQSRPNYTLEDLGTWRVRRSGNANALFVAMREHTQGNFQTRDRILAKLTAQLDELERSGAAWANLYYLRARVAALQNRRDESLQALHQAAERGWSKAWLARIDPCLHSLTGDGEFETLLAEVDRESQLRAARVTRLGLPQS